MWGREELLEHVWVECREWKEGGSWQEAVGFWGRRGGMRVKDGAGTEGEGRREGCGGGMVENEGGTSGQM